MSGRIVGEVLEHAPADLTTSQLLVLISLAETARDGDRIARKNASLANLVRRTRLSESGVKNALGELKRRALIVPLFPQARLHLAQNYRIARLDQHHRDATLDAPNVVPLRTSEGTPTSTQKGTQTSTHPPVDNPPKRDREGTQNRSGGYSHKYP